MPIDLMQFERGTPFAGDYDATLASLQATLAQLQVAQIVHGKRALIIFEGWNGSGKKDALKRLVGAWDPCHVTSLCVHSGRGRDHDRHWLAPFWSALPSAGDTTIFYRSWYNQAIDDRLGDRSSDKSWARACDEINEFEAQQRDHDTLVVKLFFHVSADRQAARLREHRDDPWRRHLIANGDLVEPVPRQRTIDVLHDMFAQTDTRWAPWRVVDANDPRAAQIAMLTVIADALAKAVPAEPPAEADRVVAFPQQKSA
ncbi:MAG: polyphosphate kinase [Pseudomonadota bacterium]|nr:polyphosphate kinase [Pseudomonadota bacterium]